MTKISANRDMKTMTIAALAGLCLADWPRPYFGAVPYLRALLTMDSIEPQDFGLDDGRGIVFYFLSNAKTWRGETARAVKAELKRRAK